MDKKGEMDRGGEMDKGGEMDNPGTFSSMCKIKDWWDLVVSQSLS